MNNENQQGDQFDTSFLSIAEHQPQEASQLLDTFVGFLSRKTDFFIGTKKSDWENLVLTTFRKYEKISLDSENAKLKQHEEAARKATVRKAKLNVANSTAQSAQVIEFTEEEAEKLQQENNAENCIMKPTATQEKAVEIYKLEEGKLMPNKGNGFDFEKYSWTQSLSDLEITVPLNVAFRVSQKDFVVKISKEHLTVGLKNHAPVTDDKFEHDINLEKSTWILLNGKTILMSLEKVKKEYWWSKIVVSDPEISTQKINPDPCDFSDLNDDLRGTVEKMMYDQKQNKMGLPRSADQKKHETIK